jgi:UDP-2-acetamido-2,6-beta-L-arabino-hexul-4-ose reductase
MKTLHQKNNMRVLITGANGFIANNLRVHLGERSDIEVVLFKRDDLIEELNLKLDGVDFVFHLAGINRPKNASEFLEGNAELTQALIQAIEMTGKKIPVIFTSSTQAELDNPYGNSKRKAEEHLFEFSKKSGTPVFVFRLPNVFGKWSRPNYNSVVATFCHNIAHDIPVQVHDSTVKVSLAYVDDVISVFLKLLGEPSSSSGFCDVQPIYEISVDELARKIQSYKDSRQSLVTKAVGTGLDRALHSTYLSFLEKEMFSYDLEKHEDSRGVFVEMLKTQDSGQFSFFTAHPGITRGGHYHHTKTEKFLVIKGDALFKFRHILTGEYYEIMTSGETPKVVETVPGWTHDITNIGEEEMVVMLWANEIFENDRPDTYACAL